MGATSSSKSKGGTVKEDDRFSGFLNVVCGEGQDVNKDQFIGLFPEEAKGLAERLHHHVLSRTEGSVTSRAILHQTLQEITRLTTSTAHVQFYLKLYQSDDSGELKSDDCLSLLKLAYHFQCRSSEVKFESNAKDEELLKDLAATIVAQGEQRVEWINRNCSELLLGLHTWLVALVTGKTESQESSNVKSIPPSSLLTGVWWWLLSSTLPHLFSQPSSGQSSKPTEKSVNTRQFWSNLYSSQEHGLSINRFQHHIFGYRGPTILLISCSDGHCYALAVDVEWRDGTAPWGGENSFLIRVTPDYRIVEEGSQLVLFNEKSRNIPRGLFVGRDRKKYALTVTDGLQQAEHDGQTVNVIDVEAWGCGGSGAKSQQAEQKKREKQDAERNAKVKLPGEWDENPDRLLLQWGGVNPSYGDQFKAELGPDAAS